MRSCPFFNCLQTTQIDNIFEGPTLSRQHSLGWICNCANPILFYYIVCYFIISIIHNVQCDMLFSLVMEFERLLILLTYILCSSELVINELSFFIILTNVDRFDLSPKLIRLFIHKNNGHSFHTKL